jgi:DNA-binding LacI/PurR family transcriptional regulator
VVIRSRVQSVSVPAITLANATHLDRAFDYFASINRRRVAVLSHGGWMFENGGNQLIHAALAKRKMKTRPYWLTCADLRVPQTARAILHGMFHAGQVARPDALFVQDDNLFEHATAGLTDAGVRAPGDVALVTHANFPLALTGTQPARRLGTDTHRVLKRCFESIDAQRRGESVPRDQVVGPLFEEELGRQSRAGV